MARPRPTNPWQLANDQDESVMWLAWLVRLRWLAIVAQIVTLSFTFMVLDQPSIVLPVLVGAIALLGVANVTTLRVLQTRERVPQEWLLAELLVDIGVLTVFFACAGGASNPFVVLYVVHTAMAALMLRNAYAVAVMVVLVLVNMLLHVASLPLHLDRHSVNAAMLMSFGQTIAFTVTVVSVGMFVMGMSSTLRRQKQRLMEHRERSMRTDRLRAVGTLAAGAAHELNTPLSTMGLRLRRIGRRHEDADTVRDVEVIKAQLDRCTDIVQGLLFGAGDPSASGMETASLQDLVTQTVRLWTKGAPLEVQLDLDGPPVLVELPRVSFQQAFINLLENAREAQDEARVDAALVVRVHREQGTGVVTVIDHGAGLPEEPERIGDPFFTTKPTGTGLGVFVARSVAEGVGGGLRYDRKSNATHTRWWFPEQERSA